MTNIEVNEYLKETLQEIKNLYDAKLEMFIVENDDKIHWTTNDLINEIYEAIILAYKSVTKNLESIERGEKDVHE